jgi:hypothetical protein
MAALDVDVIPDDWLFAVPNELESMILRVSVGKFSPIMGYGGSASATAILSRKNKVRILPRTIFFVIIRQVNSHDVGQQGAYRELVRGIKLTESRSPLPEINPGRA